MDQVGKEALLLCDNMPNDDDFEYFCSDLLHTAL
jgi:hypothetical protein